MRLRSKGLGRQELVMDFREYAVVREDNEVVVVGTIRDPVNWEFSIRFCEDDIPGMLRFALTWKMLGHVLRSLFKRQRRHHWNQEHSQHVSEGKKRRDRAQEVALARKNTAP